MSKYGPQETMACLRWAVGAWTQIRDLPSLRLLPPLPVFREFYTYRDVIFSVYVANECPVPPRPAAAVQESPFFPVLPVIEQQPAAPTPHPAGKSLTEQFLEARKKAQERRENTFQPERK